MGVGWISGCPKLEFVDLTSYRLLGDETAFHACRVSPRNLYGSPKLRYLCLTDRLSESDFVCLMDALRDSVQLHTLWLANYYPIFMERFPLANSETTLRVSAISWLSFDWEKWDRLHLGAIRIRAGFNSMEEADALGRKLAYLHPESYMVGS